ncbi:MAG: hypothetical protein LBS60_05860 [Deltaproteobacteria bacterium]|jgi:hypothetical protein|nr:hypothetical protein [Deltaproteobacteria bacterium]
MGQRYRATIYDIDDMTRFMIDADKFDANCYSFSAAVVCAHYLLRQKSHRVMWFGDYAIADKGLKYFSGMSDLLGISACVKDEEDLLECDASDDDSRAKLQFIRENYKRWRSINIYYKAMAYFNYDDNRSVSYSGFLLNHSQKLAINLADYLQRSLSMLGRDFLGAVDLIPVLTVSGGGADMAFFEGISWDTTEKLAQQWRGDSLQIVDEPPTNYPIINCCFADIWGRAKACRSLYGVDSSNYILGDKNGNRYECANSYISFFHRGPRHQVQVEFKENDILYNAKIVPE